MYCPPASTRSASLSVFPAAPGSRLASRSRARSGRGQASERRPSSARPSVSSSAYSRSLPTGRPAGQPGHDQVRLAQQPGQVHGGGVALEVRVRAEDHLADGSRPRRRSSSRIRSWSAPIPSRWLMAPAARGSVPRNSPVRSMATTSRGSSTTQITAGSRRSSAADDATRALGDVEAALAERDARLHLQDRLGEPLRVGGGHPQHVEGDALRRLRTDAGQAAELVDQVLDRPLVDGGHGQRSPSRPPSPPSAPEIEAAERRRPAPR